MTKLQLLILVGELGAFTRSCPNVQVPEEFPLARLGDLCTRDMGTSNKLLICEIRRSPPAPHSWFCLEGKDMWSGGEVVE